MDTMQHEVWADFAERLAFVVERLEEDHFLAIVVKGSNRFVQFAGQGAHGLRVEATGNAFLGDHEKLSVPQIIQMLDLGWESPTGSPDQATPMEDPAGSPNFFVDFAAGVPCELVAELAVRTLREVFGAASPIFLEYSAMDSDGDACDVAYLKLKREAV